MTMPSLPALLLSALLLASAPAAAAQSPSPPPSIGPTVDSSPAPPSAEVDRVAGILAGMSLRQKVGQLFMSRVYGYRAKDPAPAAQRSNEAFLGVADASELFERFPVGSVVYFEYAGNLQRPKQVARLSNGIQRAALDAGTVPVLISTDQEHGIVRRLGPPATQLPGAMAMGATHDPALVRRAARVTAMELRAVGIRQNLAPVADVNVNPHNPVIGIRSFGSRPDLVAEMTAAAVAGHQREIRVAATAKHFPGHGDTSIDSHTSLPTIGHDEQTWWRLDAPPFEAAIEAGVDVVMTAHVRVPSLDPSGRPATLSRPILTGVLREQLGFEGVVMTDSLTMAAVREQYGDERAPVLALEAGADILADPPHLPTAFRAVLAAVTEGKLSEERIDQSVERVLRLKERLGLLDEPFVDAEAARAALGTTAHRSVAQAAGEAAVTVLRLRQERRLPVPRRWSILVTGWHDEGVTTLPRALSAAGRRVQVRWTGERPDRKSIRKTVKAQRRHDITVVVTAYVGAYPEQRRLVRALQRNGRTIVLSVRSPYDLAWFPTAPVLVATYGSAPASMRALARIMEGEIGASGTSPVRIPYADRAKTLFPVGTGVTWSVP